MTKDISPSAADFLPKKITLPSLRQAAAHCKGCHLYKEAIQTVFSEGRRGAEIMIVGEIPGDKEDQLGKPFVGPAGILLRKTIEMAEIDLEDIYFTNVVKHFKFALMNGRRMHRTPVAAEIKACMPWLNEEIKVVQPKAILCLGSTAAKSLLSKKFLIRIQRGKWFQHAEKIRIMATFHPSAILRAPDEKARHDMKKAFLTDLKRVAKFVHT